MTTTKTTKKPTTENTLENADAEADAWRRAHYWLGLAFEVQAWQRVLPVLAELLPDSLDTLRRLVKTTPETFGPVTRALSALSIAEGTEARRLRRLRGVPFPTPQAEDVPTGKEPDHAAAD